MITGKLKVSQKIQSLARDDSWRLGKNGEVELTSDQKWRVAMSRVVDQKWRSCWPEVTMVLTRSDDCVD